VGDGESGAMLSAVQRVMELRPKEPVPEVKPCPYCLEIVPAAATRCKACTSQLGSATA
jgi:large conductance mechanosensitive channel